MQRVARLAIIEFQTTEPYSPWQNKYESVIKLIKGKSNIIRVQRNIPKRFCEFGMVWEAEIYSLTSGKDGHPALEQLTGYMIDISEWLEFEVYEILWFWNNYSNYTKPMLGRWMGVSHRVGSSI